MKELQAIQTELKAPKNLYNSFGKYYYRNAEGILEAVKPLLKKHKCTLVLSDEVKTIEETEYFYIESTVSLVNEKDCRVEVKAQAGIQMSKKGMDYAQVFGTSSSYARKYALNGMFLIDDTKDPDTDEHKRTTQRPQAGSKAPQKAAPKKTTAPKQSAVKEAENKSKQPVKPQENNDGSTLSWLQN